MPVALTSLWESPHTRVIGATFEFALILPNAANPSCRRP